MLMKSLLPWLDPPSEELLNACFGLGFSGSSVTIRVAEAQNGASATAPFSLIISAIPSQSMDDPQCLTRRTLVAQL